MNDLAALNEQEKIFLAGAIKAVIMADGSIDPSELNELDHIVKDLGFIDFDEHLARFETDIKSDEDFEYLAKTVYHTEAKNLITAVLWELALQQGFARPDEETIIRNIRTWWKLEKT